MAQYLYEKYLAAGIGVSFKGQGMMWNTAEDVAPVVQAIRDCHNMKYLELEGNSLGVAAAKEIGKALESHPEFEIALWKDLFTTRLKSEIPEALAFLFAGVDLAGAHLQRLDLSDNAIGPVAMPGLTPFFRTPSSFYIEELIVNNEGLGAEGGSTFANALVDCLELSKNSGVRVLQLKVFQCGRNRQDNKGTISWAKLFSQLGTLEEVHMPQNGINPPAIKALAEAFRNNPNLRVINLEDNTVRHDGAQILSEVLPTLVKLEELNLSDCLIRSRGAEHIGNGILKLQHLKSVKLFSNEIRKQGGVSLASKLRSLPSLNLVNLSGNELGEDGCEQIEKLLADINEVIIEDDEGEGEEEEKVEQPNENEESEEEANEEGELEEDKSGNHLDKEAFHPTSVQGVTPLSPQHSPAATFMSNPSLWNYEKLIPNPAQALMEYFKTQTDYEYHELCIFAAIHISNLMGPNTPENFNALLDEALRNTNANGFATSLVIGLGYMNAEKGRRTFKPKSIESTTIRALSEYLRNGRVPVSVFRCIYQFTSTILSTDSFNIAIPEYKKLHGIIKTRLSSCGLTY